MNVFITFWTQVTYSLSTYRGPEACQSWFVASHIVCLCHNKGSKFTMFTLCQFLMFHTCAALTMAINNGSNYKWINVENFKKWTVLTTLMVVVVAIPIHPIISELGIGHGWHEWYSTWPMRTPDSSYTSRRHASSILSPVHDDGWWLQLLQVMSSLYMTCDDYRYYSTGNNGITLHDDVW